MWTEPRPGGETVVDMEAVGLVVVKCQASVNIVSGDEVRLQPGGLCVLYVGT